MEGVFHLFSKRGLSSSRSMALYARLGERCDRDISIINKILKRRNIEHERFDLKSSSYEVEDDKTIVEGKIPFKGKDYDYYADFVVTKYDGLSSLDVLLTFGTKGSDIHTGENYDRKLAQVRYTYLDGNVLISRICDEDDLEKVEEQRRKDVQQLVLKNKKS